MSSARVSTYTIQGRRVEVPMTIGAATAGIVVTTADADAVAGILPEPLAPVRLPGGAGVAIVMMVRYLDNPLGDYDEGVVGFAAAPGGGGTASLGAIARGRVGMWVEHMPVSQPFTREAGETIWGYPKTLDELSIDIAGGRAAFSWARDGQRILDLELAARGWAPTPPIRGSTFTVKEGTVLRTVLRTRATGVGARPGGAKLRLGDHAVARRLEGLGLGGRILASAWIGRATMDFDESRPLAGTRHARST